MSIKERIRALRKERNLSQGELGTQVNLSLKTISSIETGKIDLSTEQLKALSNFFGVTADYLLTGKEGTTEISAEEQELINLYREDRQVREVLKNTLKLKKKTLDQLDSLATKDNKDD